MITRKTILQKQGMKNSKYSSPFFFLRFTSLESTDKKALYTLYTREISISRLHAISEAVKDVD